MSLNRVAANQNSSALNPSWFGSKTRWIGLLPILVLSLGLGGCALNSLGLPGNLPVPPGGGTLTIARSTFTFRVAGSATTVPGFGVQGRTFTVWIPTSGGTGTLAPAGCTISSGALPTGLTIAPSNDLPTTSALSFCKITGTITAGAGTTASFTVQAADTAVPSNTATQSFSIPIRAEFTVPTPAAFLDGVQTEHYGDPVQTKTPQPVVTTVSATAGIAPLTVCNFGATATGEGFVNPPPSGATLNTCALGSGTNNLVAAGTFSIALTATDSNLLDDLVGQTTKIVVPQQPISGPAPGAANLRVNPPLAATFVQSGNTNPASTLLDGANLRSYGTINAGAGAPNWNVAGGLGAGSAGVANYSWCVSAGGASVTAAALTGISTSCAAPTAGVSNVKLTSASAATAAASFSVQVSDAGNAAVITRSIAQGTSVINVQTSLTAAFVQGVVTPNVNPNSTLLDGANAQSYGVITANAGAPKYTASGGLGAGTAGAAAYQWCVSAGSATVLVVNLTGISTSCAAPTTGSPVLLTSASAATGAAVFSVQLTDTGNAATPPSGPVTLGTSTINIRTAFAATFNQNGNTTPASILLPGVNTRSYGTINLGVGAPNWLAAGGLGSGTAGATNYKWCVSSGGATVTATGLAGISTACAAPTTGATVTLTSASAITGAAVFSVDGTDRGNEAVPSVTITQGASTININPDLLLALQTVPPSPDPTTPSAQAVVGRTYGAPRPNVVYEVTGGLPAYIIVPSGTLITNTNIGCIVGGALATCTSANVNVTNIGGVNPSLTISATDTANPATPATAAPVTKTDIWTVNPVISFVLAPAATGFSPFGTIPDAVVGRTYGAPLADLVFTATGGLGNAAGFGLTGTQTGTLSANNVICLPATAQIGLAVTVTCNSTGGAGVVTGPAGPARTLLMNFGDTGNLTTPSGATFIDTAGFTNYSNNVNAALFVGLQTTPASPDPNTPFGQAVVGRTYGAPNKTDVVFEVTGGLPAYTITPSGSLTTNTNIACVSPPLSTTSTCNSANANVTNTGGTSASLTISATDIANATTPAAAAPATNTSAWTINPAITFSLAPGPTGGAPTGVIPDGVLLRQYGKPLGANDLVFTATGGLGNAAGVGLTGFASGTFVTNSGLTCTPVLPQVGASVIVTCNSGGGASTLGGAPGPHFLLMTFSDIGNSTTLGGSANTDTAGYNNYTNNVNAALAIALQAGSPDPTNVNAQAVVGRTYGAPTALDVVYEATGGLPAYTFTPSGTLTTATNIVCVSGATTSTCNSANAAVTNTGGLNPSLTVTATDTANATTPFGSIPITQTFTVNPALTLTVTPDPALASSTAVVGRLYGVPAGLLSPTYTAANGLSLYTFTHGGTLEANTNMICTDAATTVTCESGVALTAAGPFPQVEPFILLVTDGSNVTTPADLVGVTINKNFTINDALVITTVSVPNALQDYTYVPTGPGVTLTSTGGLGGNTWVPGGTVNGACAPTGTFPPGLSLGAATGLLSGIATVQSPTPADYTFEVCVFDSANTTTPSGTPAVLPSYLLNVVGNYTAAAAPGTDTLEVIETTTNTFNVSVPFNPGDAPAGVAVTPNGVKAYVTLNGIDDVAVVNTLDGSVTNIGGLGACTGPQGIAIGLVGGVPTAFVACTNRRIAVIDASTDTLLSDNQYGSGGGNFYGVAMNSPTDTLVYVTDSGNNELVVLDAATATEIAGSPFAAGVTTPHGVVLSNNGARVYVAGSGSDDVIVISTADNTTVVAGPISMGVGSGPEALAVTPDGARVFVTLTGLDQFAVIDDTLGTPAIIGTPISLAAGSSPWGVTIPPILSVPVTGVRVYMTQFSLSNVAIRDNETVTPFGPNAASPIALTATSTPTNMNHIPIPR